MKRIFILAFTFLSLLFYVNPSIASAACGNVGEVCCNQVSSMDPNFLEGSCNGNNTCHIKDQSLFNLYPDNPAYSECINIPCGHEGQPCCQNETTCLDEGLICESSLSTKYSTICSYPQGTNLNDPY